MAPIIRLPGGVSLGNNELFTGTSVPTATAAGDLWYKPTDNGIPGTAGNWIWTGSDWVSAELKTTQYPRLFTTFPATISFTGMLPAVSFTRQLPGSTKVYIEDIFFAAIIPSSTTSAMVLNGSNYFSSFWYVAGTSLPSDGIVDTLEKLLGTVVGTNWTYRKQVKGVITPPHAGWEVQRIFSSPVGSPNIRPDAVSFSIVQNLTYRTVHP